MLIQRICTAPRCMRATKNGATPETGARGPTSDADPDADAYPDPDADADPEDLHRSAQHEDVDRSSAGCGRLRLLQGRDKIKTFND
jgi:hypothetical protein